MLQVNKSPLLLEVNPQQPGLRSPLDLQYEAASIYRKHLVARLCWKWEERFCQVYQELKGKQLREIHGCMSLKQMETLEKLVPHDCALSPIFSHFTSKDLKSSYPLPCPQRWENRNHKPERSKLHSMLSFSVSKAFESLPPVLTSNLNCNCHGLLDCFSTPSHTEQKFLWIGSICIDWQFNSWCRFPSGLFVKKPHIDFLLEGYMKCNHSAYAISCTMIFQRYLYSSIIQFSWHFLSC